MDRAGAVASSEQSLLQRREPLAGAERLKLGHPVDSLLREVGAVRLSGDQVNLG